MAALFAFVILVSLFFAFGYSVWGIIFEETRKAKLDSFFMALIVFCLLMFVFGGK